MPEVKGDAFFTAPEWQREIAGARHRLLQEFEAYRPGESKTVRAAAFVKEYNDGHENALSVPTLLRWEKAYRRGGLAGLLPEYGKREGRRNIAPEAWKSFCGKYLTLARLSVQYCYKLVSLEAKEYGWQLPSLGTVARMVKEDISEAEKSLLRYGQKDYYDNVAAYTLRDPESISSGEVFVGDHHVFDTKVVWHAGRWVRPWVTAWMDMRSRKLVGWHISEKPCTDTIIAAFAEAALNPAIGLPREIYIDNGQDYSGYRFAGRGHRGKRLTDEDKAALLQEGERVASLTERLGVKTHFAIVENARAKVIEREFRNFVEWFSKLTPTYCGRNPKERPEDHAAKLKRQDKYGMTLDEFRKLFSDWVVNVYNKTVSQCKGREGESPDATFTRTRLPVRTASKDALQLLFMKSTNPFKVGRNGITFRGREYYSPDFVLLKGRPVYIRYREEDLTKVWVYNTKDRYLGEAKLRESIAAIGADKETLADEMRLKAAEKKKVMEQPAYKAAKAAPPPDLTEIIELFKKHNDSAPDVAPTKVIETVSLPEAVREAARRMRATGTDAVNPFEAMSKAKIEKRKGE